MSKPGKKRKNGKNSVSELKQKLERVKNENQNLTVLNQNLYRNSKLL